MIKDSMINRILNKRGITLDSLKPYKEDRLKDWKDMEYAVNKTLKLLMTDVEEVLIGVEYDVDVDGLYGGYVCEDTFKRLGYKTVNYMNKLKKHGITDDVVEWVKETGITHLFVVDAGSGDIENANKIAEMGVKVWILDHHPYTNTAKLHEDVIRVNPIDDASLPKLSGCGVVYRYVERLSDYTKLRVKSYEKYVGITVLSDICDMSDRENRYYVDTAYEEYQSNAFLQAFKFYGSYKSFYTFAVIPYLNALIRVGKNKKAIRIVNNMNYKPKMNGIRKDIYQVKKEQSELITGLEMCSKIIRRPSCVVSIRKESESLPIYSNVNGLYANQLINRYKKSSLVIRYVEDEKLWKGSFRGWNFDNRELEKYNAKVMGHLNACGVEFTNKDLKNFLKEFKTDKVRETFYDIELSINDLTDKDLLDIAEFNELTGNKLEPIAIRLEETMDDIEDIHEVGKKKVILINEGLTVTDFTGKNEKEIIVEPTRDELSKKGYQLLRK